ncbi:MAG TPA: hypothetical protein V6C97_34020 [Oculatellaceae cyanobacterium]
MEDNIDMPQDLKEESAQALSSSGFSDELNRKYPYLTAYVGFIVLYLLSGVVAGLIFAIPQFVIVRGFSPLTELFTRILQLVFGFYGFRYIVNKHVLPYNNKP